MKLYVLAVALLVIGVAPNRASSTIKVWYGDQGGSVTLPCGTAGTEVSQCMWTVPRDDAGTCSGTMDVAMSSIVSGHHPGLSYALGGRICDLRVGDLAQGSEGLWTCEGTTYQLLVNGVSSPSLFANGIPQSSGSVLSTSVSIFNTLQCSVLWSRPAANIRWVKGDSTDLSGDATTASSPGGTGPGGCPLVDGDSTWQITSSLTTRFAVGDESISCVVSHKTLPEDLVTTIRLDVANGTSGQASGILNNIWCLMSSLTFLLLVITTCGS